jgi:hypothetical protein
MKTISFYFYVAALNAAWLFILLLALASGHAFTLQNPQNLLLVIISIVCTLTTILLFGYQESKRAPYKLFTTTFLIVTLGVCGYFVYKLLAIGKETYLINLPFFLVLGFITFYTIKLVVYMFNRLGNNRDHS